MLGARSGWRQAPSRAAAPPDVLERGEQVGRVAQPARPQLEPHERAERLLGRPARGPAAAHGLAERVGLREVLAGGPVGDDVDPALDEGEQGLEPGQGGLLGGGVLGREHPALQRLLHGLGVGGVDRRRPPPRSRVVSMLMSARVVAHGREQRRGEPRHRAEQAHPGDLAHREVEPGLRLVDLEAGGELAHAPTGISTTVGAGDERERDLAAGEHLAGERAGALAELHREHRAVHAAQHRAGLVEHPRGQAGQRPARRARRARRAGPAGPRGRRPRRR